MLAHPRLLPVPFHVPCFVAFACAAAIATVPARAQVTARPSERESARNAADDLTCLSPAEVTAENLATRSFSRGSADSPTERRSMRPPSGPSWPTDTGSNASSSRAVPAIG